MGKHEVISKFDTLGNLWNRIKDNPEIQQIYVIKEPELIIRIYNRFDDSPIAKEMKRIRRLGEMFVETYKNSPEYHEQAYFLSCKLNDPIERNDKSDLIMSLENHEQDLWDNMHTNTLGLSGTDRKNAGVSVQTKILANKLRYRGHKKYW